MTFVEYIEKVVLYLTVWSAILLLIILLCKVSNRVSHMVLDSYGGWKTFIEYRKWYLKQNEEVEK
jgi:hypothetical protein